MRILVTNDDGLKSRGLEALVSAAARVGDVTVIAPATDESGQSAALGIGRPLRARRIPAPTGLSAAVEVLEVQGTPAACVLFASGQLVFGRFDLALSGVNHGPNVASDTWFSGTVGAARTACLLGLPSIAVSLDHDPRNRTEEPCWASPAMLAVTLGHLLMQDGCTDVLLNVNVPNRPLLSLAGVVATQPSTQQRLDACRILEEERDVYSLRYAGEFVPGEATVGSDIWALSDQLASVSLLPPMPRRLLDVPDLCERAARVLGLGAPIIDGAQKDGEGARSEGAELALPRLA